MLRSIVAKDESEFEVIREPDHIAKVYAAIYERLEKSYDCWLSTADTTASFNKLGEKFGLVPIFETNS